VAGFGHQVRSDLGHWRVLTRVVISTDARNSHSSTVRPQETRHSAVRYLYNDEPRLVSQRVDTPTAVSTRCRVPTYFILETPVGRRRSGERQRCVDFSMSTHCQAAISLIKPQCFTAKDPRSLRESALLNVGTQSGLLCRTRFCNEVL